MDWKSYDLLALIPFLLLLSDRPLLLETIAKSYNTMIIKRKTKKKVLPSDLLFVSSLDDLGGRMISPSVPNTMFTRQGWEDSKTRRILLFPSVDDALMYLGSEGKSLSGKTLYVYRPGGFSDYLFKPSIKDSPTSQITSEYWYLDRVRLSYITSITVGDKVKSPGITYHYGPRSTEGKLYKWKWKENLKPWEKTGKLPEQKEFGIVSDIYHSGLGRTYKKYVGRARRNLAKKLEDDIIEANEKMSAINNEISSKGLGIREVSDLGVENKLKSLASRKYNTKTWDGVFTGGENENVIPTREMNIESQAMNIAQNSRKRKHIGLDFPTIRNKKKYSKIKDVERFRRNASSAKYNIDHFRGDTPGLAHEIGHVMNYESKNPITRIHNKVANKYVNDIRDYEPKESDGLLKGIKNYFKQRSLVKEESNASKKGLKLLKKIRI